MDEAMGRRTVSGLLVTKAGPILVFREERPRHKATSCCTRLGCSSKLIPNKDRKLCRTPNEAAGSQRSPGFRKANRMPPQGVNVYGKSGSTSRNAASTSGTGATSRNAASRTSRSSSSSQSISRSLRRPASRMRKDGDRNGESVRMHRDSTGVDDYYFLLNDRHRGMRMDIDDMSYEELLALGERIGTVSTGLSDGELSKCLKRSRYVPTTASSNDDADIKCIICQEEYLSGMEVAKMVCKHYYHTTCIQQWLRQKNWCPICKSVASITS